MTWTKPDTQATPARPAPLSRRPGVIHWLHGSNPRNRWGALGSLAAGLIVTVIAALFSKADVERDAQIEFDFICNEIRLNVEARLTACAHILQGGAALFDASQTLDREAWRAFTHSLHLEQQLPGIQGLGFAQLIPPEQLAQHVQAVRREGFPDYQVKPAGERETYSAVIYLEPFSDRNRRAFGYDMLAEPVRRAAMERARDENATVLSGKVILLQEIDQEVQAGTLMYDPVYRRGWPIETIEQRRAALQGWVYSPYRMTDLMRGTLRNWDRKQRDHQIDLQIYDGEVLAKDSLLYDSRIARDQARAPTAQVTRLTAVDFAGRHWTLRFTHPGGLAATAHYSLVWLVLSSGTIISLLLSGLLLSGLSTRANAQRMAERLTSELVENKVRFDQVVEQSGTIAWEVDPQGRYTYVSMGVQAVLGYRPEELVGRMHFYDLHGESGREAFKTAALKVFERMEKFHNLVNAAQAKDGRPVWLATNGIPLFSADGTLQGYRGADTDITERELAQETLRQLSSAVEQSPVSIVITNRAGNIEYVNPKFVALTGYTRAEALGQNPRLLRSGEQDPEVYRDLWKTILAGRVWCGELHNKKKNGELYWESASISPIVNAAGHITHFLAVKEDITAQKQAEAELRETNCQLEAATARANELAVRAELASVAKSEFLANMSHEIRTPMNGLLGMIGLLLDTHLASHQRHFAQAAHASGDTLLALINNILDFSKIEARKLELETLDFSLHRLLDDCAGIMALRAHEKGLVLGCVVAPEVPAELRGDPGRLRQILVNLTGNAIKFTTRGEVVIRVSLVAETAGEVRLRFAVRDSGIGIPADKLGRLFVKFSQVDSSTTRTYGGTGLGLAISKELAELMGGEIGVQSEPGQGSEFWFTVRLAKSGGRAENDDLLSLPLASKGGEGKGAAASVLRAAGKEQAAPAELRGVRVLVVDDTPINREILLVLLTSWGLRPAEAAGGPAALQALAQAKAAQDPFTVAILDLQMPGMDGESLGRAIKADPDLGDTRLVMCGSLGQMGGHQRWEDIGFVAALTKPVRRPELHEALVEAISGKTIAAARDKATPDFAPGRGLSPARILVVEDNITNQQVAVGILKKLGLSAEVAASGVEALQALATVGYDLVLMDVQMPEMDGIEATRHIREPLSRVLNHQVPIIAMTAHALPGDREKCRQAGRNDYVSKPVEVSALVAALEKWLPPKDESGHPPAGETNEPDTAAIQGAGSPERGGDSLSPQLQARDAGDRLSPPRKAELAAALAATHEDAIPVFDRAALLDRVMDDEEIARVVIAGFLGDIPGQIEQLKGYAAAGDTQQVEQQAHRIKGAAATVGGEALSALAAALEQAGSAGDVALISARVAELDAQFAALKGAMQK